MRRIFSRIRARIALQQVVLLVATLVLIDIASWFLLPDWIALRLDGYKAGLGLGGIDGYPKDYFVANPTRGFDIRPSAEGIHRLNLEDAKYPIWSNRLGCFDQEWQEVPHGYFYFAGDSYTWGGYASFENSFPTLFQRITAIPSIKCGVVHTGTLHEFEKFQELLNKIGHTPRRVVVGYYPNDVANDYLHPHSTVIMGWLVDQVFLDERNESIRIDRAFIKEAVQRNLAASQPSTYARLCHYSLSTCVIGGLGERVKAIAPQKFTPFDLDPYKGRTYNGHPIRDVYSLPYGREGMPEYLNSPFTKNNRRALSKWQQHAKENNYELTLILIPPKKHYISTGFFSEFKMYLAGQGINFIDLTEEFERLRVPREHLYWDRDAHFSPEGSRIVAEILARRFLTPAISSSMPIRP